MVRLHWPTSRQTQEPRQTQILIKLHRNQWESMLVFVCVQHEHLYTILQKSFYLPLYCLGIGQCEHTTGAYSRRLSACASTMSQTEGFNTLLRFNSHQVTREIKELQIQSHTQRTSMKNT